jgi:hypothetical protein
LKLPPDRPDMFGPPWRLRSRQLALIPRRACGSSARRSLDLACHAPRLERPKSMSRWLGRWNWDGFQMTANLAPRCTSSGRRDRRPALSDSPLSTDVFRDHSGWLRNPLGAKPGHDGAVRFSRQRPEVTILRLIELLRGTSHRWHPLRCPRPQTGSRPAQDLLSVAPHRCRVCHWVQDTALSDIILEPRARASRSRISIIFHRHCEEPLRRSNPSSPRTERWIASLCSQ